VEIRNFSDRQSDSDCAAGPGPLDTIRYSVVVLKDRPGEKFQRANSNGTLGGVLSPGTTTQDRQKQTGVVDVQGPGVLQKRLTERFRSNPRDTRIRGLPLGTNQQLPVQVCETKRSPPKDDSKTSTLQPGPQSCVDGFLGKFPARRTKSTPDAGLVLSRRQRRLEGSSTTGNTGRGMGSLSKKNPDWATPRSVLCTFGSVEMVGLWMGIRMVFFLFDSAISG